MWVLRGPVLGSDWGASGDSSCCVSGLCHCSICQCGLKWWGVADGAFSWPRCSMTDSSPGEVHRGLVRSVFQWWCPPGTGRGCFLPHGSGGSEELSGLEAMRVAALNVGGKQLAVMVKRGRQNVHQWKKTNWPSLNSRLSSWFGQRFTTSVTCSAFL